MAAAHLVPTTEEEEADEIAAASIKSKIPVEGEKETKVDVLLTIHQERQLQEPSELYPHSKKFRG